MERPKLGKDEEPDEDVRVLTVKKANYGPVGITLDLRWSNGVFVQDDVETENPDRSAARDVRRNAADDIFIGILSQINDQGRRVNPSPSPGYAPTLFEKHPDAKGFTKMAFAQAMERLRVERDPHRVGWPSE